MKWIREMQGVPQMTVDLCERMPPHRSLRLPSASLERARRASKAAHAGRAAGHLAESLQRERDSLREEVAALRPR